MRGLDKTHASGSIIFNDDACNTHSTVHRAVPGRAVARIDSLACNAILDNKKTFKRSDMLRLYYSWSWISTDPRKFRDRIPAICGSSTGPLKTHDYILTYYWFSRDPRNIRDRSISTKLVADFLRLIQIIILYCYFLICGLSYWLHDLDTKHGYIYVNIYILGLKVKSQTRKSHIRMFLIYIIYMYIYGILEKIPKAEAYNSKRT